MKPLSLARALGIVAVALGVGCGGGVPASVRAEMAKTPPGQATVVEFVDFECPFCRRMHTAIEPVLTRHRGHVRVVWKQVPLSMHPHAESAARVFLCAEENGANAEALAHKLFNVPPEELAEEPAIAHAVEAGAPADKMKECVHDAHISTRLREDGRAFGDADGQGVPLTFVGKTRLDGAVSADEFARALDDALGSGGR